MVFHSFEVGSYLPSLRNYYQKALTIVQCFTILWQQPGIQALQVLNSKQQWINATPIPGTLVVKYVRSHSDGMQWTSLDGLA